MTTNELDKKVDELRSLRSLDAEVKNAIADIEDSLKSELVARNTDVLNGSTCTIIWKTIFGSRFDSAAFKISHADLFKQFSKATTSRRLVIA